MTKKLFICRKMMKQAEEMHCNVGFLDPQIFSAHDYVVGAYNTGSHWVLVIIAMKWNVVWYLDSAKSFPLQKFKDVVTIVNW